MTRFVLSPRIGLLMLGLLLALPLRAQTLPVLPPDEVPMHDLSAFSNPSQVWRIAGDVQTDLRTQRELVTEPGTGVLVGTPSNLPDADLVTRWEHGDLDLELEVMLAAGATSGILFQGRYEVQLADSWTKDVSTFADMGAIDRQGHPSLAGIPPRTNVAKAPGLWQHLRIEFRAPRFDDTGRKTANARFLKVELNGVVVQQDVEVSAPTTEAIFDDERPTGPLVIQNGAVAIRRPGVKRYERQAPLLQSLHYNVYEGQFHRLSDLEGKSPAYGGELDRISWEVLRTRNDFAIVYEGDLPVPASGRYQFGMICEGGCRLEIGDGYRLGPEAAGFGWFADASPVDLEAGTHPFRVIYYKSNRWWRPTLEVYVEGPGFERTPLHEVVPGRYRETDPIHAEVGPEPRLLRSFFEYEGTKLTHVLSVGSPASVHFSYDLASATLLQAWRGPFLDVTQMWHERGEPQLAVPLGSALTFPSAPLLSRGDAAGPAADAPDPVYRGYELDENGYPSFRYEIGEVTLLDHLEVAGDGTEIRRSLKVEGERNGLWLRLAVAKDITPLGHATYAIGDRSYYLTLGDAAADAVILRHRDGRQELMLPLSSDRSSVTYAVKW